MLETVTGSENRRGGTRFMSEKANDPSNTVLESTTKGVEHMANWFDAIRARSRNVNATVDELDGRAYVYLPAITKEFILKQAVRDLADRMFGGSSEDLVMSLIQTREVDVKRIAKLARKIADKEKD